MFVFIADESLKDKLIATGGRLVGKRELSGKTLYIFDQHSIKHYSFTTDESLKLMYSNKMTF